MIKGYNNNLLVYTIHLYEFKKVSMCKGSQTFFIKLARDKPCLY